MSAKIDYNLLAKKYGTPFYIFDKDTLTNRITQIKNRLPSNARLCYAIKANAFLAAFLKDQDILFEVCSPGELSICEKESLLPDKIVFSGVVKTKEDIKSAYDLQVHTITLESKTHCKYLLECVKEAGSRHEQNIILRLSSGNQFGMSEADLEECIQQIKQENTIKISGIHYFSGTQKKLKTITEEISRVENFCDKIKSLYNLDSLFIEYGPGLSYDYFSTADEKENYSELESFVQLIEKSSYNYVIELGRYIASPCGQYVTKIMDVKATDKNKYCLIDGGINHINYYGQLMGMKVPPVSHISNKEQTGTALENYTIAGSLCTTADIVIRQLPLSLPEPEDLLVFEDIGAYSITEGIYLFLSHPLPSVLSFENGSFELLRKSTETYILNS